MEFPDLGKHCSESACKQLDFLPMKCDACSKIFCNEHIMYEQHTCPEAYKKDNQVPVCPLCNTPIPVKKGEAPDIIVGQHIDSDCQSDPAKEKRKIYTNRCSFKGCKQKELVPFNCGKCRQNYCVRHRHETDHNCHGFQGTGRGVSNQGAAAIVRASTSGKTKPQQTSLSNIGRDLNRERQERQARTTGTNSYAVNSDMTEDEALARALALSLAENNAGSPSQQKSQNSQKSLTQEEEDLALARALQASEEEARRQSLRQRGQQEQKEKSSCQVS